MIARIAGKIVESEGQGLVVDIHGIGYAVTIGNNLAMKRDYQIGDMLELAIFTLVRDDEIRLIGFEDRFSRKVFALLMGVSGVGPKAALNLVDEVGPQKLLEAISGENLEILVKVTGIGKKTAQRIRLELKEKIRNLPEWGVMTDYNHPSNSDRPDTATPEDRVKDARSALSNLGFGEKEIERTLKRHVKNGSSLDDVIRKCLADLRKMQ
jgi:holliday junction DNA helicase RuvA